jgi:hypothetical protein
MSRRTVACFMSASLVFRTGSLLGWFDRSVPDGQGTDSGMHELYQRLKVALNVLQPLINAHDVLSLTSSSAPIVTGLPSASSPTVTVPGPRPLRERLDDDVSVGEHPFRRLSSPQIGRAPTSSSAIAHGHRGSGRHRKGAGRRQPHSSTPGIRVARTTTRIRSHRQSHHRHRGGSVCI